jgi:steroid delta-isomerase-like uncharacterized protein
MPREQLLQLLQHHRECFEALDPHGLAADYTEDAVVTSPMFPRVVGREAIERSFVALFDVFPEWRMTFDEPILDENHAAQYCVIHAVQRGTFMGIPGSGRRSEFKCVLLMEFRDGLISEERRVYDFTGLLIQLGVLRSKPVD